MQHIVILPHNTKHAHCKTICSDSCNKCICGYQMRSWYSLSTAGKKGMELYMTMDIEFKPKNITFSFMLACVQLIYLKYNSQTSSTIQQVLYVYGYQQLKREIKEHFSLVEHISAASLRPSTAWANVIYRPLAALLTHWVTYVSFTQSSKRWMSLSLSLPGNRGARIGID